MKPMRIGFEQVGAHDVGRYWLEKKYDGHRAILLAERGKKILLTRQKVPIAIPNEMTSSLASISMADGTVLDGEIWNPAKRGGWTADGRERTILTFWDCVREGETDLSLSPTEARREALLRIIGPGNELVQVVERERATVERVKQIYEEARKARKERQSRSGFIHGVVLKLVGSPRRDHATRSQEHSDWMKVVFDGMSGWPAGKE